MRRFHLLTETERLSMHMEMKLFTSIKHAERLMFDLGNFKRKHYVKI